MIGQSSELEDNLAELHNFGYSLNLLLDCRKDVAPEEEADRADKSRLQEPQGKRKAAASPAVNEATAVQFKIDARDLAFLRSVGIDPTRPARSQRTSSEPSSPA